MDRPPYWPQFGWSKREREPYYGTKRCMATTPPKLNNAVVTLLRTLCNSQGCIKPDSGERDFNSSTYSPPLLKSFILTLDFVPIFYDMPSRLDAMDAQRYDLSKRRSRSHISTMTYATAGHYTFAQDLENEYGPWIDRSVFVPNNSPASSAIVSETDLSSSRESPTDPAITRSHSNLSTISFTLEDSSTTSETHCDTQVAEEDDFTVTCTFIRPISPFPSLGFLSWSSSSISRSTSPNIFRTLNCVGSIDSFEDEIDQLQNQRMRELEGKSDLRVIVTQETEIHREELWRGAIQETLYRIRPLEGNHSTVHSDY